MKYHKKKYERVMQKWLCGRKAQGNECFKGPDASGKCAGGYECHPINKDDHWYCTRPKKYGGTCGSGPLPDGTCCHPIQVCQPVLNIRYQRARLVTWIAALLVFILMVIWGGGKITALISSGKLTSAHASIAECYNCHEVHRNIFLIHDVPKNKQCLTCHNFGANNSSPHNVHSQLLTIMTQSLQKRGIASEPLTTNKVACATCHKEHKGNMASLLHVSDSTCQSCHSQRFKSFTVGHPDFTNYPNKHLGGKIHFDHDKHFAKHFKKTKFAHLAPEKCTTCHKLDNKGQLMQLRSYKVSCSACHNQQIMGDNKATDKGVSFLSVFALDTDTLYKKQIAIGEWPMHADESITSFTYFILACDPNTKIAFDKIKGLDLDNLQHANTEQLKAIEKIVWAYKTLLYDLANTGPATIFKKLDQYHKADMKSDYTSLEMVPEDTLRSAISAWFPELKKEIEMRHKKGSVSTKIKQSADDTLVKHAEQFQKNGEDWARYGGWYWQDYTLYYRPRHHLDRFIHTWLDMSAKFYSHDDKPYAKRLFIQLADKKAPGVCTKCHTISTLANQERKIQWYAFSHRTNIKDFTHFSHKPHINIKKENCDTCHKYAQKKPIKSENDFLLIKKKNCVQCHTEGKVASSCITCHNYHSKSVPSQQLTFMLLKIS